MGEKNHYYHLHTINVPDQIVLNHPLPFYLQHDQSRRTYNNKRKGQALYGKNTKTSVNLNPDQINTDQS